MLFIKLKETATPCIKGELHCSFIVKYYKVGGTCGQVEMTLRASFDSAQGDRWLLTTAAGRAFTDACFNLNLLFAQKHGRNFHKIVT